MKNTRKQQETRSKPRGWLIPIVLVIALIGLALLGGLAAFTLARRAMLSSPLTNVPLAGPSANLTAQATPENSLPGVFTSVPAPPTSTATLVPIKPSLQPWDGAGRVTILILGLDYRDWETGKDYSRSDTMILLTLDPLTHSAGILSIPRDMWVAIPGFTHAKINTAYYLGEAHKLPGGGPALAVKTVEQFLGVPINYYAQIDFQAFVKFIDEIGGVKIDVPEKITIDLLGGGPKTKKTLQPGVQLLPGEWALAYARARHTGGGDFDRARRQQQVIMAIRNQIMNHEMLPTLIQKAPILYQAISAGIHTNLGLEDALRLALLAMAIPEGKIQRGVIGQEHVIFGFSPDNLSILSPIPDKIQLLRDQIFATTSSMSPMTPGDSLQRMLAEGARITIVNGSKQTDLGDRTAKYLRSQGVNIVSVSPADQTYANTSIIDHSGRPFTLKYLINWIGIIPGKIFHEYNPSSPEDIEIILGTDWATHNSLP
jgi:polyisoprenyl-teichoic acid--peptidoglycan teichoic acid transferase